MVPNQSREMALVLIVLFKRRCAQCANSPKKKEKKMKIDYFAGAVHGYPTPFKNEPLSEKEEEQLYKDLIYKPDALKEKQTRYMTPEHKEFIQIMIRTALKRRERLHIEVEQLYCHKGFIAFPDIVLPKYLVSLEVDGLSHEHHRKMKRDLDRERLVMERLGFGTIRIMNHQLRDLNFLVGLIEGIMNGPEDSKLRCKSRVDVCMNRKKLLSDETIRKIYLKPVGSKLTTREANTKISKRWGGYEVVVRPKNEKRARKG